MRLCDGAAARASARALAGARVTVWGARGQWPSHLFASPCVACPSTSRYASGPPPRDELGEDLGGVVAEPGGEFVFAEFAGAEGQNGSDRLLRIEVERHAVPGRHGSIS
ncbi:hypothetical protein NOVOSPHI9U_420149 [Novosphingobium sp. 9U]|nr:hypothetical protein NOVOSPHI9U_420149 [Novosphingobium sp. 9U]